MIGRPRLPLRAVAARALAAGLPASASVAPRDLPCHAPPTARAPEPKLPHARGWPAEESFPRASGTSRLAGGALLWSNFVDDDHGAAGVPGGGSVTALAAPVVAAPGALPGQSNAYNLGFRSRADESQAGNFWKGKDGLNGTPGSDRIKGRGGEDRLNGRGGDDCVNGGSGADEVKGGAGDDQIRLGRGKDSTKGGRGDDVIRATRGARDRISCGRGRDKVYIDRRKDRIKKNCERVVER